MRSPNVRCCVFTLLTTVVGCGSEPSSQPPIDAPPIDASPFDASPIDAPGTSIGPAGGTVFGQGMNLTVPPGALSTATRITVTRTDEAVPPGYVGYSPVWRFAPEGLQFAVPATLQMSFVGDASRAGLYWTRRDSAVFERLTGVVSGSTVIAPVSHFSLGFVGDEIPADGGALDASTLDAVPGDAPADAAADVAADAAVPLDAPADVVTDAPADVVTDAPADVAASLTAPRPLSPASGAAVGSGRPVLRWALGAGTDGAHVELCRDRAFTASCVSVDQAGSSYTPAADPPPGAGAWRRRGRPAGAPATGASATWRLRVGAASSAADVALLPTLDVNGDGFDDLAVSDPTGNGVYVYAGSSTGLHTPATSALSGALGEQFGAALSAAGDVNGDGYGDLLVGAGRGVRVFLGGAAGVGPTPSQTLPTPAVGALRIAAAGDIDRDGYADVLVGAVGAATAAVFYGGAGGLATRTSAVTCGVSGGCGGIVAGAGDTNGDGFADVLTGANLGRIELHLGSATGVVAAAAATLIDGTGGGWTSAAGLGDVDGDGRGDVAANPLSVATALIYLGSATGVDPLPASSASTGETIVRGTRAGDVNGDGYADLVMPLSQGCQVFPGSRSGVRTLALSTSRNPTQITDQATTGDFNGDGFSDVATNSTSFFAHATVFAGSASGTSAAASVVLDLPATTGFGLAVAALNSTPSLVASSSTTAFVCAPGFPSATCVGWSHAAGDRFGASLAYPVNVDGDATSEVLVGAPGVNAAYAVVPTTPERIVVTLAGPSGTTDFGAAVASVGDVNHDGISDAVVGAPASARAFVYLGAASATHTPLVLSGAAGSHFGRLVARVGDLTHDGFADVAVGSDNRLDVFLGSASGVATTPALTLTGAAGSRFGESAANAGDVNRDGTVDLIVGAPGINTAYVYLGGATLLATPYATLVGAAGSAFGAAVLGVGDSDRDNYGDVAVGAPGASTIFIYPGGATGVGAAAIQTIPGTDPGFGASLSLSGTFLSPASTGRDFVIGASGAAGVCSNGCDSLGRFCFYRSCGRYYTSSTVSYVPSFGAVVASQ